MSTDSKIKKENAGFQMEALLYLQNLDRPTIQAQEHYGMEHCNVH